MRLLPRSLFSRLVLVLLAGLVVAQLLSFAIHMHERGELLSQASGMQAAQRIADIVRLLDSLGPAEQRRIVRVLNAPPIMVSLDRSPLAAPEQDTDASARAALFGAMLRRFLGDARPIQVAMASAPLTPGPMRGFMGPGMHGGWTPPIVAAQPGFSFVAQLRLQDGTLVTFDSRQSAQTASWPYRLLLSLGVLLVAVIAVSLVAVRWATRPLNALADAADQLGRNIHRPPMQERGPLEVARAARAFNTMQARLAAYLRERTSLLAAMSHDLKTPITRLRLRAELLDDPRLRTKFTADLQEMESLVKATLETLRGHENGESAKPVDIMALLESLQADMAEIGGPVSIEGESIKPYPGKPVALKRCLANLLDNAIKYGNSAVVTVTDSEKSLRIKVRDEGPGIPQEELARVFEPFFRLEGSRNRATGGTGLGLTIARNIAHGHGGTLTLGNHAQGGLEATLTLPRSG